MSETAAVAGKAPSMGKFERFLTLWVALCIIVGIGLGQAMPGVFHALGAANDPPSKWWTPLISSYWSWKGV